MIKGINMCEPYMCTKEGAIQNKKWKCCYCNKRLLSKPYLVSFSKNLPMLVFCSEMHANLWVFCKLPLGIKNEVVQDFIRRLKAEVKKR